MLRFRSLEILLLAVVCFVGPNCAAWAQGGVLRPGDLVAKPEAYVGRTVELEIVEPLGGPTSPAALASVEYGQVRVLIPDAIGVDFSLVPAGFQMADPNRYRRKFDRVLTGPLKVRGEVLLDAELERELRRKFIVLRVASLEPIDLGAPLSVASMSDLKSRAKSLDRKRIVYEGTYRTGFEVSSLDGEIWVAFDPKLEIVGSAPKEIRTGTNSRVRVIGVLFAKEGARYGHLGAYSFQIQVTKLEHLAGYGGSK